MPWFKVDDAFALSPKVMQAGNQAIGLWVRAGAWSMQQLTDGHIPAEIVPALGGRPRDAQALTTAGLWDTAEGGYQFHDWDKYQPAKTKLQADREATRQRVEHWRKTRTSNTNVTALQKRS